MPQRTVDDLPFTFEVILYIDNREKKNQSEGNYVFKQLEKSGLRVEEKALPLGDFLWVLKVEPKRSEQEILEEEEIESKSKWPISDNQPSRKQTKKK